MADRLPGLRAWARNLKRDIIALWLAARDSRVPWCAKLVAGAVAAYALSPIDLIPDFIPVLGYLDDLLLVPAGIWLALRLVPKALMQEFRSRATGLAASRSLLGAGLIAGLWLTALAAAWLYWGSRSPL